MATKDSISIREQQARERLAASFQHQAEVLGITLIRPYREPGGGPDFQYMQTLEALAALAEQIEQATITALDGISARVNSMLSMGGIADEVITVSSGGESEVPSEVDHSETVVITENDPPADHAETSDAPPADHAEANEDITPRKRKSGSKG